jgi:hypothetical protein
VDLISELEGEVNDQNEIKEQASKLLRDADVLKDETETPPSSEKQST